MIAAIIVFMVLVTLMCIFSVTVIVIDIRRSKREAAEKEPQSAATDAEAVPEGSVAFNATKATHWQKYADLSTEDQARYDEIARYAAAVPQVKNVKSDRAEEFKLYTKRLVRLIIKRGAVMCEFTIPNEQFSKYVEDNKVSVKHATSVLKVTSEKDVAAAKDAIDIAVNAVMAERARRHEQELERRREARRRKAANSDK